MFSVFVFANFLLIISNVAFTSADLLSADYDYKENKLRFYEIKRSFTLICRLNSSSPPSSPLQWYKDDHKVSETPSLMERSSFDEISGTYKLTISHSAVSDTGNYSCRINDDDRADIYVISDPYVKLPSNSYVIEDEQLSLNCNVQYGGPKAPVVYWKIGGELINETDDRIQVLKDNRNLNTILQIQSAKMTDRNHYTCIASLVVDQVTRTNEDTTFLRVKDKLAALWPFLGICAEVIILLIIIYVYERRRDKTELVESDSEQNPEQRNYANDSIKESSDVRQRK